MDKPLAGNQLAKLLLIAEGKAGKTDFAAMAAAEGFNVLYLDGDVASQTVASLPLDAKQRIYLLKCGDAFGEGGGIEPNYAHFFKDWISKPMIIWNDSRQRLYSIIDSDKNEEDEFWLLRPARMDHTCVLVIEYTRLAHSAMQWAANQAGVDLGEVDERKDMRGIYQAAGEKLTQYLLAIQRAPCHVICLTHPKEYVKLTPPTGKTIGNTKEKDMVVAFTKLVPTSSSNNHAFGMSGNFTDVAWMITSVTGDREIDFRIDANKICGGHFNAKFKVANRDKNEKPGSGFTFGTLVRKLGGTVPGKEGAPINHWLTIQTGYEPPKKITPKALVVPRKADSSPAAPKKVEGTGMSVLAGLKLKQTGPANP